MTINIRDASERKTRILEHLKPETWLGYNASGDLVKIRKKFEGKWYEREIDDPDITDKTVVKWVKYKGYVRV